MHNQNRLYQLKNQLNRLVRKISHWKVVFANWQLGTRDNNDGAFLAIQDAKEADLRTNIKLDALIKLLLERGLVSEECLLVEQIDVANKLETSLEGKFVGAVANDDGMVYDARFETTKKSLGFPL